METLRGEQIIRSAGLPAGGVPYLPTDGPSWIEAGSSHFNVNLIFARVPVGVYLTPSRG